MYSGWTTGSTKRQKDETMVVSCALCSFNSCTMKGFNLHLRKVHELSLSGKPPRRNKPNPAKKPTSRPSRAPTFGVLVEGTATPASYDTAMLLTPIQAIAFEPSQTVLTLEEPETASSSRKLSLKQEPPVTGAEWDAVLPAPRGMRLDPAIVGGVEVTNVPRPTRDLSQSPVPPPPPSPSAQQQCPTSSVAANSSALTTTSYVFEDTRSACPQCVSRTANRHAFQHNYVTLLSCKETETGGRSLETVQNTKCAPKSLIAAAFEAAEASLNEAQ